MEHWLLQEQDCMHTPMFICQLQGWFQTESQALITLTENPTIRAYRWFRGSDEMLCSSSSSSNERYGGVLQWDHEAATAAAAAAVWEPVLTFWMFSRVSHKWTHTTGGVNCEELQRIPNAFLLLIIHDENELSFHVSSCQLWLQLKHDTSKN